VIFQKKKSPKQAFKMPFPRANTEKYCYTFLLFRVWSVLYGCETWSLIFREEHRLKVFENRVLRKIFGPKRDEVIGEWRRLHNEELYDLYSSPNIIRVIKSRMKWRSMWHVRGTGEVHTGFWWGNLMVRDHCKT
jgi:hypothetical protein